MACNEIFHNGMTCDASFVEILADKSLGRFAVIASDTWSIVVNLCVCVCLSVSHIHEPCGKANVHLRAKFYADRSNFCGDTADFPSWICFTCIWTTHEEHLLVFVTVQNLVGIGRHLEKWKIGRISTKVRLIATKFGTEMHIGLPYQTGR